MLCAGTFAAEVAYIIEEGYAIPAMLATGLSETVASAMWAVGPVLGLFFHSYLGSASDRCMCGWGKRRPFIFALAVFACLATLLFPYGTFLSESVLRLGERSGGVFVMIFTASTFVAMDFFLDALQTPLRAYLLDTVPTERSEHANYTFTAMMCTGAIVGSLIAGIPWSSIGRNGPEEGIGDGAETNSAKRSSRQLEAVYGIAAVIFAVCILLCLNSIQEKNASSTQESPSVEKHPLSNSGKPRITLFDATRSEFTNDFILSSPRKHSAVTEDELVLQIKAQTTVNTNGVHFIPALRGPSPLPRLKTAAAVTAADHHIPLKTSRGRGCFSRFVENIYESINGTILFSKYLSPHFFNLCWTVLFSWIAFMSMFIYFTSFMGQVVYGGDPHAASGEEKELFDHGVRIGFLVMLFQDCVTMAGCLFMTWLSDYVGMWQLLVGVLVSYAVVCFTAAVWPSLLSVIFLQLVTGLLYSNMQCLPYTLLSYYKVIVQWN